MQVTLTRMEGKLDGVVEKVSDLRGEVDRHRDSITKLQSIAQQLQSDMSGAEEARSLAAAAVKSADEARVAAAKAVVDNSNQKWTPVMRLYATLGALASLAVTLSLFIVHLNTTGVPVVGK